jgi:hypothetical protein
MRLPFLSRTEALAAAKQSSLSDESQESQQRMSQLFPAHLCLSDCFWLRFANTGVFIFKCICQVLFQVCVRVFVRLFLPRAAHCDANAAAADADEILLRKSVGQAVSMAVLAALALLAL